MREIIYQSIGIVYSPFKQLVGMPIQPSGAKGQKGCIEIFRDYEKGLKDIEGFSHLIVLYHFHKMTTWTAEVVPYMDDKPHGIFATRAPASPNAIGISILKLLERERTLLYIEELDILDQTPVLDIKPFFGPYDNREQVCSGWLDTISNTPANIVADNRFA